MTFPSYPAYKESGVEWLGEVPSHWTLTPIKHLALLNPRKSDFAGDTEQLCSFVPMEKLKTGVVQLDEVRPIEEVIGGYTYFEDGDVLQAKVTPCFENKNIAIAKGLTNGIGFGSSEINVLRPYQGVNAEYLYYRVQEDSYMSFCTSSMIGAGGLKRVPTDVINNFKIAAPEQFEQTQIARFLDHETARIDALIEEQQRLIELLKEKRQAVISHAVTKGLDPTVSMKDSGVEWLGEVPAHWDVKALRYLGECQNGINIGGEAFGSGSPFVSYGDVHKNDVLPAEVTGLVQSSAEDRQRYSIDYGDVFFTRTSETVDEIGFSATCLQKLQNAVFAGFLIRFRPSGNSLTPGFSKYYFRNQRLRIFFNKEMNLVTRASLSQDLLKQLPVTLPPVIEQIKISDFLDKVTAEFASLLEQGLGSIDLLIERRSALISAAVTGKIDVRGWQPSASVPSPELELEAV
ncbi:restriction endonuclease subunit S [Pseudomonas sp. 10B1]|uniref:restriction endonuclease subunit S n=1 Tax=unclassified Pseudomonas TaxID=196821 RepID=UPI002B23A5B9|nr:MULTISPECIES: restriction endonuclease subunit S [unclassified Pseudomonas]MEA9996283.1 restriction endonuclease subunit S [Pseudomonas sp. AA4]MEB0086675.1 restriction endonuclease subunit S [Pseudomonas sp. RTI1]MEB0124725.1 restriction endonuclease subunit S [Pseudomonas sp. CCC1.2]MEB0154989.1 restriction endonuclease subunit S [Pseudomonas sp. CCC4.3]MEB0217902.1 restriction endonuclease subunit S [Pseudomonas sp. AB12(2023)]